MALKVLKDLEDLWVCREILVRPEKMEPTDRPANEELREIQETRDQWALLELLVLGARLAREVFPVSQVFKE